MLAGDTGNQVQESGGTPCNKCGKNDDYGNLRNLTRKGSQGSGKVQKSRVDGELQQAATKNAGAITTGWSESFEDLQVE